MQKWRAAIKLLYRGRSRRAELFRYGMLALDTLIVLYFIVSTMVPPDEAWVVAVDYALAPLLIADFLARLVIARDKARYVFSLAGTADVIVILSLLVAPWTGNLGFLRVLRALRLLRSYHLIHDMRRRFAFFRTNEEVIQSTVNLLVFILVVTAMVYVMQVRFNPDIENYVDALYFTVTTLTTTGFGDITLHGSGGRLLSVVIMVFGVALFLRLLQTIFRPSKVRYRCPNCGLNRHEPDAVHCKHCGTVIDIETEGED
jgi:voltage-gated potassium channel